MTTASELSMEHGLSRLAVIILHHYLSSRYYFWSVFLCPARLVVLTISPYILHSKPSTHKELALIWLHLCTSMFYFKFRRNWITLEYLASIFAHQVHVSRTVRPIPIVRPIPVSYVNPFEYCCSRHIPTWMEYKSQNWRDCWGLAVFGEIVPLALVVNSYCIRWWSGSRQESG